MPLAIFDMDETLIGADCCTGWAHFMIAQGLVKDPEFLEKEDRLMDDYRAGNLDMQGYVEFLLSPVKGMKMKEIERLAQQFCDQDMVQAVFKDARKHVELHKDQNHTPLVISASPALLVRPIAKRVGIEHVIGIELDVQEGIFTGTTKGVLSYQMGKVRRLESWAQENSESISNAFFYSDSHNDLPLLEIVENPRAVNPDPRLKQHAEQHGWPILNWA